MKKAHTMKKAQVETKQVETKQAESKQPLKVSNPLQEYNSLQGYVVVDDIYNQYGTLVIRKNTIITEEIKKKIKIFQIDRLRVKKYGDSSNTIKEVSFTSKKQVKNTLNSTITKIKHSKEYEDSIIEFKNNYSTGVNTVKEIINDLAAGRELNNDKIKEVTSSLYSNMSGNIAITECLNKIKDADEYTYSHSINVALYAMLIGKWLNLSENDIKLLMNAGMLHDVGKAKVPLHILNKNGPLTKEEFEVMKKHPVYGYEILKNNPEIDEKVKIAVLTHHEKENGAGYPLKLKGEQISLYAKIISIADVYDALTSERVYKKRQTPFDTFKQLEQILSEGALEPTILYKFIHNLSQFYVGSLVEMSTGIQGEIVFIPPHNISNPVVKIDSKFFDLSYHDYIKIVAML